MANKISLIISVFLLIIGINLTVFLSLEPQLIGQLAQQSQINQWIEYIPFAIGAIYILIVVSVGLFFIKKWLENSRKEKRLRQIGLRTRAKIIEIQSLNIKINGSPYVKILVEAKQGIPGHIHKVLPLLNPPKIGDSIEVLYNPSNPAELVEYKEKMSNLPSQNQLPR